jgi:hypothetical protein
VVVRFHTARELHPVPARPLTATSAKGHNGMSNAPIRNRLCSLSSVCLPRPWRPPLHSPLTHLTLASRCSLIFISNHLPLIVKRDEVQGWVFEWDEDALIAQASEGLPEEMSAIYVGCLPVEVDGAEQDVSASKLW